MSHRGSANTRRPLVASRRRLSGRTRGTGQAIVFSSCVPGRRSGEKRVSPSPPSGFVRSERIRADRVRCHIWAVPLGICGSAWGRVASVVTPQWIDQSRNPQGDPLLASVAHRTVEICRRDFLSLSLSMTLVTSLLNKVLQSLAIPALRRQQVSTKPVSHLRQSAHGQPACSPLGRRCSE